MQNVPCMEYPVCMISLLYRAYSVCPILFLIVVKAEKGINYETHCMRILVQQCVMTSEETVSILSKGERRKRRRRKRRRRKGQEDKSCYELEEKEEKGKEGEEEGIKRN